MTPHRPPETSAAPLPRRKRRSTLRRLAGGLIAVVLIAGIVLAAFGLFARARYRAAERRYSEAGRRLELSAYTSILPHGEANGSDLLDVIAATRSALGDSAGTELESTDLDPRALRADPELAAHVDAWLAQPRQRLTLELFDAAAKPARASDLPPDGLTGAPSALYATYTERRTPILAFARALRARSAGAAAAGRFDEAYDDLAALLVAAGWMYEESPGVMPWLLASAVTNEALDGLERTMLVAPPPEATRTAIAERIGRFAAQRIRGLESEAAYAHRMFRTTPPLGGGAETPARSSALGALVGRPLTELWAAGYLDLFAELLAAAEQPPSDRAPLERLSEDAPFYMQLGALAIPNLLHSVSKGDELATRIELATIALDGERRLADGTDGEVTLVALRRAIATDRFSGEPFLWGGPDGCTLYSVGVNGIDDGAARARRPAPDSADDLAWRLPCALRDLLRSSALAERPPATSPPAI